MSQVQRDIEKTMADWRGCMFCELGNPVVDWNGKPAHNVRNNGDMVYCLRDTDQTPKRAQ